MPSALCYILHAVFFDIDGNRIVSRAHYSGHVPSESFFSIDVKYYKLRFRQYLHSLLPRRVVVYVQLRRKPHL